MKKLIVFDLDGTLAESKSPLDEEMAALLCLLLSLIKVAIISGGDWTQFKKTDSADHPFTKPPSREPESPSYLRNQVLPIFVRLEAIVFRRLHP
ncbi:hypothetical protein N9X25_09665 [Verrucomicrobiales bacterium]|nr:hypothetical protein [Verrucomicrobiales bacterium]